MILQSVGEFFNGDNNKVNEFLDLLESKKTVSQSTSLQKTINSTNTLKID